RARASRSGPDRPRALREEGGIDGRQPVVPLSRPRGDAARAVGARARGAGALRAGAGAAREARGYLRAVEAEPVCDGAADRGPFAGAGAARGHVAVPVADRGAELRADAVAV